MTTFIPISFFRLIVFRDPRANLADLSADVHLELQQLGRAGNAFRSFDLTRAQLDL